jgi:hypothetical protein
MTWTSGGAKRQCGRALRGTTPHPMTGNPTCPQRERVSGCPKNCKLAHTFLWEYSDKRLQLAQLSGPTRRLSRSRRSAAAPDPRGQRLHRDSQSSRSMHRPRASVHGSDEPPDHGHTEGRAPDLLYARDVADRTVDDAADHAVEAMVPRHAWPMAAVKSSVHRPAYCRSGSL